MENKEIKSQAEGYLKRLFTGRISRVNYLVGCLIILFGVPMLGFPLIAIGAGLITAAIWLASLLYAFSFAVRRFHDIGKSGIELLWFLVPLVNLYFLFIIFLKAGEEKKNEFGPVPERQVNFNNLFGVK